MYKIWGVVTHLPGPTNPWALQMPTPSCHVAPHTGVRVDRLDTCGLLPHVRALCAICASRGPPTALPCIRALCATYVSRGPPAALPHGLRAASHPRGGPACHIRYTCHVIIRGSVDQNTPLFAILVKKINLK